MEGIQFRESCKQKYIGRGSANTMKLNEDNKVKIDAVEHKHKTKKDEIAKIAARIFCKKGYKTASMQDIAQSKRGSKGGIYHYFKSKDDILSYILLTNSENFITALESCLEENRKSELDAECSFKRLIHVYAKSLIREQINSQLILRERHQLTKKNLQRLLMKEREIFLLVKEELRKVPRLKGKFDLSVMSFLIISMCHWMGYWLKEKGTLSREDAIDQSIEAIFSGILED
jgi:AcrR family transcriptional regulator